MKIKEYIQIETKKEITTAVKCDVCGKEIVCNYWILATSHRDWGNDSIESYEYFDLCSKECIKVKFDDYYKKCKSSRTQEFDLEQAYFKRSDVT